MQVIERSLGWPTPMGRASSADFQSAVSQVCNLQAARTLAGTGKVERVMHLARPQIKNLRYSSLQVCATPESAAREGVGTARPHLLRARIPGDEPSPPLANTATGV